MAYIAPDGVVYVCRKVPLRSDYQHTILFKSEQAQHDYIVGKAKYLFDQLSYQRKDNNVLRVNMLADNMLDCNYLAFQNSRYGGDGNFSAKWFYAFITSVEYVNNNCANIHYEIDVMQTWLFNYNLGECFIERQHSKTDNIGDNVVPEDVAIKPYFHFEKNVYNCPFRAGEYKILVMKGNNLQPDSTGKYHCVYDNVFAGVDYAVYDTPTQAYSALKAINATEGSGGVVAIYQVPSAFWVSTPSASYHTGTSGVVLTVTPKYDSYHVGYTPKNNKLYTQQFYGLLCVTSQGDSRQYAYEYFAVKESPEFLMASTVAGTPEVRLVPQNYKQYVSDNYMEGLTCTDFPMCAWSSDAYAAWLALNSGSNMLSLAQPAASGMLGVLDIISGDISGGIERIGSALPAVANFAGKVIDMKAQPAIVHGTPGSASSYTLNNVGFTFYDYYLQPDDAKRIDDYFSMYGYAVKSLGVPMTASRKEWNYVKTANCNLLYKSDTRSIPVDDAEKICAVYNRGFTFWHNADHLGDYSLDNPCV